ncbi:MAG: hypothetical protein M3O25_02545 [Actinomycetota bacterium]|nr:hypothetical protein [Actinomycetota bacterium]
MTAENEYERDGAGPLPIQSAEAAGLEGNDEQDPDVDPEVAAEVRQQEETREAEELAGPLEDAVEDPADGEGEPATPDG